MPTTLAKERRDSAVEDEAGMTGRGEEDDDDGLTTASLMEAETSDKGVGMIDEATAGETRTASLG
jgi:hypothetical protein